jgi:hypothetical protein
MRTNTFKYGKSYRIPYRGCYFHSFAELKYAMAIENDYRYLREPVIIGYDPKTLLTTNYFREETKMYTPDFLVRPKAGGERLLIEIKPEQFRGERLVDTYHAIANNYIRQNNKPWQFRMIFEDEIVLPEVLQPKFDLFWKKRRTFESYFGLQRLDRQYNAESIKYFSSVPLFPEDGLSRNEYARFVRLGA